MKKLFSLNCAEAQNTNTIRTSNCCRKVKKNLTKYHYYFIIAIYTSVLFISLSSNSVLSFYIHLP